VPRLRALLVAAAVALGMGFYLQAWVGWPTYLAVGVAALMAVVILISAAALEDDRETVDAAWREASADLDRARPPEPSERPDDGAGAAGPAGATTGPP
jgi:hypothetical protein